MSAALDEFCQTNYGNTKFSYKSLSVGAAPRQNSTNYQGISTSDGIGYDYWCYDIGAGLVDGQSQSINSGSGYWYYKTWSGGSWEYVGYGFLYKLTNQVYTYTMEYVGSNGEVWPSNNVTTYVRR